MKPRRLYYRKKGKSIVIEGRSPSNKTILIWTLPEPNKFYSQVLENASFLPKEKQEKIKQKYMRLAYKDKELNNTSPEVPTNKINRTENNDAKEGLPIGKPKSPIGDLNEYLYELTK